MTIIAASRCAVNTRVRCLPVCGRLCLSWSRQPGQRLSHRFAVYPNLACDDHRPEAELLEVKRLRSDPLINWGGSGVCQNGLEGKFGRGSNSLRTGPPYFSRILDSSLPLSVRISANGFECVTFRTRIHLDERSLSLFRKIFKPAGACLAYSRVSLLFPGHFVPAPFFNEGTSIIGTYRLEFCKFLFVVRILYELGDADRGPSRQDRLFGPLSARAAGGPTAPRKADDHCDDCPTNKTPNSKLKFPSSFWFH